MQIQYKSQATEEGKSASSICKNVKIQQKSTLVPALSHGYSATLAGLAGSVHQSPVEAVIRQSGNSSVSSEECLTKKNDYH